jgi:tRNA(Ile)-lysidine synthase
LFEELTQYGFSHDTVEQVSQSFHGQSGKVFYSSTHQILHDREFLVLTERKEVEILIVKIDKDYKSIEFPLSLKIDIKNKSEFSEIPKERQFAILDFEKLNFPLELRLWRNGDKFMPFGMEQFKKVSDFLIDLKVSLVDKEKVYVLTSNNEIVWVVGMRIDNRFKVDGMTQRIFRIEHRLTNNGNY